MPSERRAIEVAQGHTVTVRRNNRAASRPGYVCVEKTHRTPFEVEQWRWDQGKVA